jgi:DNA primase
MAIEKTLIEAINRGVDLVALARRRGIEVKKNGGSWMGRCPFHEDKTPSLSITPGKNLFQCFGCGAAGDAIRFVELLDKVSFPEAVKRLSGEAGHLAPPQKPPQKTPLTTKAQKLLARVVGHYQHCLGPDSRGLRYLKEERGITHTRTLTHFGAGYADGSLKEILPEDEAVTASLKQIGILNARGNEAFYRCVVFPLYSHKGAVVGLYGRNTGKGRVTARIPDGAG